MNSLEPLGPGPLEPEMMNGAPRSVHEAAITCLKEHSQQIHQLAARADAQGNKVLADYLRVLGDRVDGEANKLRRARVS